jgi:hypothetical protein
MRVVRPHERGRSLVQLWVRIKSGHTADRVIRDDLRRPSTEPLAFVIAVLFSTVRLALACGYT